MFRWSKNSNFRLVATRELYELCIVFRYQIKLISLFQRFMYHKVNVTNSFRGKSFPLFTVCKLSAVIFSVDELLQYSNTQLRKLEIANIRLDMVVDITLVGYCR